MLNVVTVEVGDYQGRGRDYVERLHDMVRRNLAAGFRGRFVVLTDSVERYEGLAGVEARAIAAPASWWAKMELYNPANFEAGERVLYFDLDTAITGPLDAMAEYPGAFGTLRDVYRPAGLQSSVIAFGTGTKLVQSIWTEWLAHKDGHYPGGDQEFLECFWRTYLPARLEKEYGPGKRPWPADRLQDLYPGQLRSYKVECASEVPRGTCVVFFHGLPRPHEITTGWVPEVWKVGGGSSLELVSVPNVPQELILTQIAANTAAIPRALHFEITEEPHQQTALIIGGGPSLKDFLPMIAAMQQGGCFVFATNATDAYLRQHGITADAHLVMDARESMVDTYCPGGKKLYASMVHPALLGMAMEDSEAELTLWHPFTDGAPELLPEGTPLIGGGTTIGIRTMVLCNGMGFRKLVLFGFDSCYQDQQHHAYAHSLNAGERVLDVLTRGRAFKAAPWMLQQAEDFKQVSALLAAGGTQITVIGDGLIPWIASGMTEAPAEPFKQVKGLWWPTLDEEARPAVLGTLPDCEHYADLAVKRRTVIQAGGNVGVWALALAARFEQVLTFEPDPDNFTCLQRNCGKVPNINAYPLALGNVEATGMAIERQIGNCGATRMLTQGGDVRAVTIDSFALSALDLLILDVEGFEQLALMGAEQTLKRCAPVIVLELKDLGRQYGYTDSYTVAWLNERGYQVTGQRHRDVIFTKRA